ncbi:MAG: response regulator [Chlamydiota bacterium]
MKRIIIIIDDDRDMQAIYRHMLKEEAARYSLRFAGDAARALRMLAREPADLVISDVIMGTMDGVTFLTRLRERGVEVPVLIVSVLHPDMLPGARGAKRVYFMQKPITGEGLRDTLKKILKG